MKATSGLAQPEQNERKTDWVSPVPSFPLVPQFILHADDIGLSPGITRSILAACDEGHVRSVSLIVNGTGIAEAVAGLAARPHIRIVLHLNLLEGAPLAGAARVPDLVGPDGRLASSFPRLWRQWLTFSPSRRAALSAQIAAELHAQICAGIDAMGPRLDRLRLDGHTHVHALPFVLDAILGLDLPRPIEAIRLPLEPWHVSPSPRDRRTAAGSNLLKHVLLARLSAAMADKLEARRIASNPLMLGILHTGRMTPEAIAAGRAAIARRLEVRPPPPDAEPIEILLHPGRAAPGEAGQWRARPDLWAYYTSADRDAEAETARSPLADPRSRGS